MNDTFDPTLFNKLKEAEKSHFWFLVRRKWILNAIRKFNKPSARVLEIGCGTGNVSSYLATKGYEVIGCELYKDALDVAWPGFSKVSGNALNLPFDDNTFDIVGLFDVIEHFDDDRAVLHEARRVLKKDGLLVITVPALSELWSYMDDIAFHKRRYSAGELTSTLTKASFRLISAEYMFMMLYFPMKILRGNGKTESDLFKIGKTINLLSTLFFECERLISRFIKLPIGTSLIALAKKTEYLC